MFKNYEAINLFRYNNLSYDAFQNWFIKGCKKHNFHKSNCNLFYFLLMGFVFPSKKILMGFVYQTTSSSDCFFYVKNLDALSRL